jgi:hypothetical protein
MTTTKFPLGFSSFLQTNNTQEKGKTDKVAQVKFSATIPNFGLQVSYYADYKMRYREMHKGTKP